MDTLGSYTNYSNNNDLLVAKVFNNSVIVEKILHYTSENIMYDLSLREVNQQFNTSCLQIIRKNYGTIKIKFVDHEQKNEQIPISRVFIHNREVEGENIERYFQFLVKYARVRVKNIITRDLWKMTELAKLRLHDIIHKTIGDEIKTMIGMEDICITGCLTCINTARRLKRYGPMQTQFFDKKFENHQSFDELIVTDYLLDRIANKCVKQSNTKDECYEAVDHFVDSNISCNQLTLYISEMREAAVGNNNNENEEEEEQMHFEDGDEFGIGHHHFPREVLELMIKKWKVKSVRIAFLWLNRCQVCRNNWFHSGWFTPFRFNDHFESNKQSCLNVNFDQIAIDLKKSRACSINVISLTYTDPKVQFIYALGYVNIIANMIRLFPTKNISINFHGSLPSPSYTINSVLESLFEVIFREKRLNLDINIRLFFRFADNCIKEVLEKVPRIYYYNGKNIIFKVENRTLLFIEKTLKFDEYCKPTEYCNRKYAGRKFIFHHEESNCNIKMDIFMDQLSLTRLNSASLKDVPQDAFLSHFLYPYCHI